MLNAMPRERSPVGSWRKDLAARLRAKNACVGVVGLGYVGLPMLVAAVRAGFRGVGIDVDASRVAAIKDARSFVSDVEDVVLRDLRSKLRVSANATALRDCDVVLRSTAYPGTTDEILRPIRETSGLTAGRDFGLAHSPERIDPGRGLDHIEKTPKVVGG
jgi:UDP-N-acetyl-D-glucosamine dehydrogenase